MPFGVQVARQRAQLLAVGLFLFFNLTRELSRCNRTAGPAATSTPVTVSCRAFRHIAKYWKGIFSASPAPSLIVG